MASPDLTPACLRRLLVESPPDVRLVARRLRQMELLCDVTLVFNEDEVDGTDFGSEEEADKAAAPLQGEYWRVRL